MNVLLKHCMVILMLLMTAHSLAAKPIVIDDFEKPSDWYVLKGKEKMITVEHVDAPIAKGKSLKIAWDKQHAHYGEVYERHPTKLGAFHQAEQPYHAKISIDLFSPGAPEPVQFSIRLQDQEGEVFQWAQRINTAKQGWQTLTFEIKPDNAMVFWGGKKETPGKLDGPVHFVGITVDFNRKLPPVDDSASRFLVIDNITITYPKQQAATSTTQPQAHLKQIKVGLQTGHPMSIVDPKSPAPVYLTLANESEQSNTATIQIKAQSFLGRTFDMEKQVTLIGHQTRKQFLPLPQDQQDLWWIYHVLTDPLSDEQIRGRELFAVMKPNGPTPAYHPQDRFLFGMCAHSEWHGEPIMQREAEACGLIGVDIARTNVDWGSIQRHDINQFDWQKMDRLVERYRQQNIEIQSMLAFTPRWASTGDTTSQDRRIWGRAAPQDDAWANYIDHITRQYRDDIRYWEIWNEPDLSGFFRGSTDAYVQMCRTAYPIIKQNLPHAKVMTGGFSSMKRNPQFIQTVLPQIKDHHDILAIHIHDRFEPYVEDVAKRWLPLHQQYTSDKGIYFNETGRFAIYDSIVNDTDQAVTLVKKVAYAMSVGAVAYNWYVLRDDGDDPAEYEHRYGMITRDFQPKPAYVAYNTMIAQLRGFRFIKRLATSEDQWLLLFAKDDHYKLLGWKQQAGDVGQLHVDCRSQKVNTIDMMGNGQTLPQLSDGGVIVSLGTQPAYWDLGVSKTVPMLRESLVKLSDSNLCIPGQRNTISFEFTNPLKKQTQFTFRLNRSQNAGQHWQQVSKTIAAGQTTVIELEIQSLQRQSQTPGILHAQLSYQDRDFQLVGSCELPIQIAGVIPSGSYTVEPNIVLDQLAQRVDLFAADPANSHRVWKGKDDLTAICWLAVQNESLCVQVKVNDDQHVQPNPINELWRSDSIQLAMQLPGQQGLWELTIARNDAGQTLLYPGRVPIEIDKKAFSHIPMDSTVSNNSITYQYKLPLSLLQITQNQLKQGIRLSLLVNDDDGLGRDGWMALSPGIGTVKDASQYPLFILAP